MKRIYSILNPGIVFLLLLFCENKQVLAQINGCTDPQATNYNSSATINDGSCIYPATNLSLTTKANLATPLFDENSGINFFNTHLWTHNDSGNSNSIYRVDSTSSTVFQTVLVTNATNIDWEDITSNNDYLYVGDFGNNNGNRQNLRIYRINKNDLPPTATTVNADIINFSFSDQTSFPSLPNNNNFDCESLIFLNDSLHLFSKNWVDKQSKHYVLPAVPGTHVAQLRETLNAGFLITGASVQNGGVVALVGYDNTGVAPVYLWMLYDYKNGLLFNGNKRRFNLSNALANGQVEGVDFKNAAYGYISNERFNQPPFNIPPRLKSFNLESYLPAAFVYPEPEAEFSASITSVCKNSSVTFSDLSENDPTSWQWLFPGGTPSSSTTQNPQITYNTTGSYSVTLIVGNSTGYDTIVKTNYITINSLPPATITANGPTQFCINGSVLLSANNGTGLTYQWRKYAANIIGETNPVYSATATGNYRVIVTNQNGCSKTSSLIAVTGPPAINITVTGSLDLCPGDSVKFEVPSVAGNSYQWKKNNVNIAGATANFYYAITAGAYKLKVTNQYGCSKTSGIKNVTTNCRLSDEWAFESMEGDLKIYPNPSSTYFTIEMKGETEFAIIVADLGGRIIEQHTHISSLETFEFGRNLSAGIYIGEIIYDNKREIFKIIRTQ